MKKIIFLNLLFTGSGTDWVYLHVGNDRAWTSEN